ncbi:MAG: response regulator, partial [Acidobacteria bacterium]|nr:response regulator [Acidobacteriota bacterium]
PVPRPLESWSNSSGSLSASLSALHPRSDWAARYAQPEATAWHSPFVTEAVTEAVTEVEIEAAPQPEEVIPTAPLIAAPLDTYETAAAVIEAAASEAPATYITWEGEERPRTSFDAATVWGPRQWEVALPDPLAFTAPVSAEAPTAATLEATIEAAPEATIEATNIATQISMVRANVSADPFAHLLAQLSPEVSARTFESPAAPVADSSVAQPAAEDFAWDDDDEALIASPAPTAPVIAAPSLEWEVPAELLEIFLPEAEEHLAVITTSLPKLASQPDNKNLLQEIRRSSHSLKGSSAVVGFQGITKLSHRMEDLLDLLYDGELTLTPEMLDLLFSSTEALENLLNNKSEPELIDSLYAAYERILAGYGEAARLAAPTDFFTRQEEPEDLFAEARLNEEALAWAHAESVPSLRDLGTFPSLTASLNESLAQRAVALSAEPREIASPALAETAPIQALPEAVSPIIVAPPAPPPTSLVETPASEDGKEAQVSLISRGNYVRVPIERLDAVVKLVTELIVNRATLEQNMGQFIRQLEELRGNAQRLSRVANRMEVQYEASTLGSGLQSMQAMQAAKTGGGVFVNALGNGGNAGIASKLVAPVVTNNTYGFDALEFDRYTEFHLLLRELTECSGDMQTMERELRTIREYFESALNRQGRLNSEMQDQLMRLRMVPLASLASRFHRTAHQVAQQRNKQVNFIIEGEDTRLDKTVIEEMADPLLHILRNAIDHGIEPALVRQSAGKAATGTVRLRAFHEGTQTVIQIKDDGTGLHPERLRAKAIQSGVVSAADAVKLTEEELFALIFLPGFSTAAEISEISGRGVGMDVVKTTIQRLKGRIDLDSKVGRGTTFTIRLPMTLAVMRALLVKAHKQTFAIPPVGLQQIVKLTPDMLDRVGEQHVIRVNNKIYPLMQLGRLLNLRRHAVKHEGAQLALLMNLDDRQFAIAVDETLGGRDVVVKNLGNHIREVRGITGTTLMGDGSAVLILNLPELVRDALRPAARQTVSQTASQRPRVRPPVEQRGPLSVMVVDDSLSVRRVLANRLNAVGWKPIQAKDGLDALEQLQGNPRLPDTILLDIEMPRMDGYEFLSALRKNADYAQIPVVMITSRAGQKHRDRAFEAGANEYLVKPYQDEELLTLIRRLAQVTE